MTKKTKLIALLSICFSMLLSGCFASNKIEHINTPPTLTKTDGVSIQGTTTFDDNFYFSNYIPSPSFKYGIPLLYKVDSNGNSSAVCNLDSCSHDSVSCNAYINLSATTVNYFKTDYGQYIIGNRSADNGIPGLEISMLEDNSVRDAVNITFHEYHFVDDVNRGDTAVIVYNEYIIYKVSVSSYFYESDSFEEIFMTNLETSETESLFSHSIENADIKVLTVIDDNLIFYIQDNTSRFTFPFPEELPDIDVTVYSLNLSNDRLSILSKHTTDSRAAVGFWGDNLYTIEDNTHLYSTNLRSLKKELILETTSSGHHFSNYNGMTIVDNHIIYSFIGVNGHFALNLDTFESFPFTQTYKDYYNYDNVLEINAIFDNNTYLVGQNYQSLALRNYALIQSENFWTETNNFTPAGAYYTH